MMRRVDALLRRMLDITVALLGLLLLSPLLALIAIAIKVGSKGPVFYRARRVGQGGREIQVLKFRTMVVNADRLGPGITTENDARITPVGRLLRTHRLDELPQLWNVLIGEMSLVGPRPEDPRYVAHYTSGQRYVLKAKPGITGPAQIAFRNEAERLRGAVDPEKAYLEEIMPVKVAVDIEYLLRRTVFSDIGILFDTLRIYTGNRILFLYDLVCLVLAYGLAFAIRFDNTTYSILGQLTLYWPVFFLMLAVKLFFFARLRLYRRLWRYAGIQEWLSVITAVILSTAVISALILVLWIGPWYIPFITGFPRSVIAIDAMLTLLLVGGVRFAERWQEARPLPRSESSDEQRVLVIGAGDAGVMVAREMQRNRLGYRLVGFLDDAPDKQGLEVAGVKVLGGVADLPRQVAEQHVDQVLIAMPTAPGAVVRRVFELARQAGVQVRTLPGYFELIGGQVSVQRARSIRLEDLLRREPMPLDLNGVAAYLTGAVVLVTGAGGSIGSEICRQVARLGPARLVLFGHGENSLYHIQNELRRDFPTVDSALVLGDVRDPDKVDWLIEHYHPQVIFHAAAYKHVPLLETNEDEAILNNVLGTYCLLQAAERHQVPRLVFISSDKAVEPSSVMGATKRLGELMVQHAAQRNGHLWVAVRFGNVLGSRGSVVPLFQAQIEAGGPVTVTHPHITRYFMTIPEAVQLVLQAAALGQGGQIFVLDMGQPVCIYDLACDLIRLNGLEPERDIPIVFTGLRPGEKLHESLLAADEQAQPTAHPGIYVINRQPEAATQELDRLVEELAELARRRQVERLRQILGQWTNGQLLAERAK